MTPLSLPATAGVTAVQTAQTPIRIRPSSCDQFRSLFSQLLQTLDRCDDEFEVVIASAVAALNAEERETLLGVAAEIADQVNALAEPKAESAADRWLRFWGPWPLKIEERKAREIFESLDFDAEQEQVFWEGHEAICLYWQAPKLRRHQKAQPPNPRWWLHDGRWTDQIRWVDNHPVVGPLKQRRLDAERQATPPAVRAAASKCFRSPQEQIDHAARYERNVRGGAGRNSAKELQLFRLLGWTPPADFPPPNE